MMKPDVQEVLDLLAAKGNAAYFGEDVSILEHSLQSAYFARRDGASAALVTAALVHDIGHLLHGLSEDIAQQGHDGRHEEVARGYLEQWFGDDVITPVRLHVAAKRYLCATEPAYLNQLSPSSVESLALQGGPMSPTEVEQFSKVPFAQNAVALRRWDDEAKIPDYAVPVLADYLPDLQASRKH